MLKKIKKWALLFVLLILPYSVYTIISKGQNSFIELAVIGENNHHIPPFSFLNQDSVVVTNADYEDNIYIANSWKIFFCFSLNFDILIFLKQILPRALTVPLN